MGRKILIISYRDLRHPEMGGAEVILHQIYKRIHAGGNPVTFLTCRFPGGAARDEIDGMEVIRIGNLYNFNFATGPYYRRRLRGRGYDVIVEDLNKLPFYTPLFEPRVPVLVNVPHLFGTTVFRQAAFPLALYVYLQEKAIPRVYRRSEFQVLSESTREDLRGRGIPEDRLHVIRSGIDHEYYVPPERNGGTPGPVLLYLGRLKKYKCIEHPIQVLARLRERIPGVEYWIAGDGNYRAELERIAREHGVASQVRFLGHREGREKLELLGRTRVLVYTSPKEGWGLSVIEANAMGIPCVASDSPGLRESVRHEETGYLVPHGDGDALRERLYTLLTDDAAWKRMSGLAREWAARFSWEAMARETSELIETAVRRRAGGGTR
jgi:glycosyltransferase involved in cell wall biosynthesis